MSWVVQLVRVECATQLGVCMKARCRSLLQDWAGRGNGLMLRSIVFFVFKALSAGAMVAKKGGAGIFI